MQIIIGLAHFLHLKYANAALCLKMQQLYYDLHYKYAFEMLHSALRGKVCISNAVGMQLPHFASIPHPFGLRPDVNINCARQHLNHIMATYESSSQDAAPEMRAAMQSQRRYLAFYSFAIPDIIITNCLSRAAYWRAP